MKITVRKSGGYAGIEGEPVSLDTGQLDPKDGGELERLAEEASFFSLPESVEGERGLDFFRYEVTLADNGRTHTVAFSADESEQTAPLRRLAERVEQLAAGE
jgi:emfourin